MTTRKPPTRGGTPESTAKSTEASLDTDTATTTRPRCELCDRHREPAWPGHPWCAECVDALGEALDRRRATELRLPPLDRAGAS